MVNLFRRMVMERVPESFNWLSGGKVRKIQDPALLYFVLAVSSVEVYVYKQCTVPVF